MVGPGALLLVGAGLAVLPRLFGGSTSQDSKRAWINPPSWARLLFGASRDRILLEDAIVEILGLAWFVAGIALAVAGQSSDSVAFKWVALLLVVALILGGLAAIAISLTRRSRS